MQTRIDCEAEETWHERGGEKFANDSLDYARLDSGRKVSDARVNNSEPIRRMGTAECLSLSLSLSLSLTIVGGRPGGR